jgi:hypothetical protein
MHPRQQFPHVLVAALLALLAGPAGAAVSFGQVDTFEAGGLLAWEAGGGANPNGPVNEISGGPGGADDNFLRLTASGQSGPGGKLVVFNSAQWTGDYLDAGVAAISMQVNNLGATDLVLRLILEGGSSSLTSISPVNLPSGSGWNTVSFSLAAANLSGGDYLSVLGNVTTLNLVHSPDIIAARSGAPNVAAQLGVDNISAVPEPGKLVLSALGLTMVAGAVIRKRRARA